MFCYWAGNCGAKKHLQYLMQLNGKKFCLLFDNTIMLEENTVHWHGYLNKKDSKKIINRFWDNDSYQTIFYRDGDELLSVSRHRRKWERLDVPRRFRCDIDYNHEEGFKIINAYPPPHSLIDHSIHRGAVLNSQIDHHLSVKRKLPKSMSEEYAERYRNDPKLKNTFVHYEAVKKSKSSKITVDDVPDCHVLMPYDLHLGQEDNFYTQDWNRYRNIVPYKSNLVDSARNLLDLFDEDKETSWKERWDNSIFDVYETDKETIWKYLDEYVFTKYEDVPRELKKYDIEFEYFDLDKDSYKKTFEIDKDPLFRLMTYNTMDQLKNFPTKETRDRYHRLTDIAKEYVAQCGREDNRITL